MNIELRSTNKLVLSSGREDFAELVAALGLRETAPATEYREWRFSKAVFIAVISTGYVCAALLGNTGAAVLENSGTLVVAT
jgi:hypothetical protein